MLRTIENMSVTRRSHGTEKARDDGGRAGELWDIDDGEPDLSRTKHVQKGGKM